MEPEPPVIQRKFGCRRCLVTLAVLFVGLWLAHWWFGPIRYLQFHASNVRNDYDDSGAGFTGDFTRKITANCSEDVFHRYAAQQGLHQRLVESQPSWLPYETSFLPQDLKGAYYDHPKIDYVQIIAWKEGRLYHYVNAW